MTTMSTPGQSSIPVIDCSGLKDGGSRRLAIAREIGSACEQYGFLVVSGHGVPKSVIGEMREVSNLFFSLSMEAKMEVARRKSTHRFRRLATARVSYPAFQAPSSSTSATSWRGGRTIAGSRPSIASSIRPVRRRTRAACRFRSSFSRTSMRSSSAFRRVAAPNARRRYEPITSGEWARAVTKP